MPWKGLILHFMGLEREREVIVSFVVESAFVWGIAFCCF